MTNQTNAHRASTLAMPVAARFGLGLLAASLLVGVVTMAGPGGSPGMAAAAIVVFGALLVAGVRRQNWARFALAVLVAIGVALNAMLLPLQLDQDRLVAASTAVQSVLQVFGVLLLFRRTSIRWYSAPQSGAAV